MNRSHRLTALLLAAVMVLSLAACGSREASSSHPRPEFHGTVQKPVERPVPTNRIPPENTESTTPTAPATPVVTPLATPAEPDRDSLEQIADLVTGEDYADLTDEELTDLIEDQLRQEESADSPADPDEVPVPGEPAVETDPEGYDEQGAQVINMSFGGTADQTPLVTIRWRPKANAVRHFTLNTTLIDPVNPDHAQVTINCPIQTACVYCTETAQATCTQPGGTALVCVSCGSRTPLDSTLALGYDYAWTDLTQPDCESQGSRRGQCRRCGTTTQETLAPLGHDWSGTLCGRCGAVQENPFTDVPEGSFYYDPVIWAVVNGVTNALDATHFGPFAYCNRAQVVTFLYRAFA